MKTVSRLVRRYIAAAFGIVLLIFTVNVALFIGVLGYYGFYWRTSGSYQLNRFADSFTMDASGVIAPGGEHTLQEWMEGREWSMLLDDNGEIIWQYNLPDSLNHRYTAREIASFARWYLDDYPVFSYRNGLGLLITGLPRGSVIRWNFYTDAALLDIILSGFVPLLLLDAALILGACLLLGWRAARGLRNVAGGIDALSQGETVTLPETGMAGELAEKLNRTSARLARQGALIEQRDSARTSWIAGVSHDIRTPLSLILGYAEQLERDPLLPDGRRQKAASIRVQSQKISALIEDLNLTSKLQYNAQPLRLASVAVGPLLRSCVTDFFNSGQADACALDFELSPAAERFSFTADAALLGRAFENLLINSARHNPDGCTISVRADVFVHSGVSTLTVRFSDDGAGYPPAVLLALCRPGTPEAHGAPHILGLHVVDQIVRAHGGRADFFNQDGAAVRIEFDSGEQKRV